MARERTLGSNQANMSRKRRTQSDPNTDRKNVYRSQKSVSKSSNTAHLNTSTKTSVGKSDVRNCTVPRAENLLQYNTGGFGPTAITRFKKLLAESNPSIVAISETHLYQDVIPPGHLHKRIYSRKTPDTFLHQIFSPVHYVVAARADSAVWLKHPRSDKLHKRGGVALITKSSVNSKPLQMKAAHEGQECCGIALPGSISIICIYLRPDPSGGI